MMVGFRRGGQLRASVPLFLSLFHVTSHDVCIIFLMRKHETGAHHACVCATISHDATLHDVQDATMGTGCILNSVCKDFQPPKRWSIPFAWRT
jgi:hypothetical protein